MKSKGADRQQSRFNAIKSFGWLALQVTSISTTLAIFPDSLHIVSTELCDLIKLGMCKEVKITKTSD